MPRRKIQRTGVKERYSEKLHNGFFRCECDYPPLRRTWRSWRTSPPHVAFGVNQAWGVTGLRINKSEMGTVALERIALEKPIVEQERICRHRRRLRDQRPRVGLRRSPEGIIGDVAEVVEETLAEETYQIPEIGMMTDGATDGARGGVNTQGVNRIPT